MSHDLVIHVRNEETLWNLERAAEALGISMDELAEAALEIVALSANFEGTLKRISERLQAYDPQDLERDIQEFARSEVAFKDPLQARLVEIQDPYGIGALFADPVERG